MGVSGSTMVFERLPSPKTAALTQFDPEPQLGVRRAVQSPDSGKPFFERRTEPARTAPTEVSFGPFRLLPTQFLLLEGDKPVPLGSRALEILIVLLERPGELISKQDLMARVWPNVSVGPENLTVHISALRRTLRDGRDGNRFIINIPGRGYKFVGTVAASRHQKAPLAIVSRAARELEGRRQTNLFNRSSRALIATDATLLRRPEHRKLRPQHASTAEDPQLSRGEAHE
jgi:DNA-binding winged helix-turn-helix (wHTH) protein